MYSQGEPGRESRVAQPTAFERRLALIHRVLVPSEEYPKEYAVLVTDRRSVFVRQPKTRNAFVLRGEMRYGTALVTDVAPKTLEDYRLTILDSLATEGGNLAVPHGSVTSLAMRKDEPEFRLRDLFIWLTMRRQGETFQVYNFQMDWRTSSGRDAKITFYAVPLGMYFKPNRQTKSRETILREYALEILNIFQNVLPGRNRALLAHSPLPIVRRASEMPRQRRNEPYAARALREFAFRDHGAPSAYADRNYLPFFLGFQMQL